MEQNPTNEIDQKVWVQDHAALQVTQRADKSISNAAQCMPIYYKQEHTTLNYQRNLYNWCVNTPGPSGASMPLDLTCISPWNSRGMYRRGGCLVTSRHFLCAAHYPLAVGDTIRFVTNDNTVITRSVVKSFLHSGTVGQGWSDIALMQLDADVPSSITPARVLPLNWKQYFPLINNNSNIRGSLLPVLQTDQQERIRYAELYSINMSYKTVATKAIISRPQYTPLQGGSSYWVTGDSGSPLFMIIDGMLVLLTCARTRGTGPAIHEYINFINKRFLAWGDRHTLHQINLTAFKTIT